jgi:Sortase and related acyltransferases
MSFVIRPAQIQDLEHLLPIYNAEILYGTSTWNSTPKTIQDFQNMLSELNAQGFPLLVAEHSASKQIAGYADYSTISTHSGL